MIHIIIILEKSKVFYFVSKISINLHNGGMYMARREKGSGSWDTVTKNDITYYRYRKKYDGMTDEEKEKQIKEYRQDDRDDRNTNQVKYWINKGYSEEEAKEKVSERQSTFTLEKCIAKYGEEEGTARYNHWKEQMKEKRSNTMMH